jgi:hypothetical protein
MARRLEIETSSAQYFLLSVYGRKGRTSQSTQAESKVAWRTEDSLVTETQTRTESHQATNTRCIAEEIRYIIKDIRH